MLRITVSSNQGAAARYFEDGLQRGDYYASGEQSMGIWGGKAARRMGLSGEVRKEDFVALAGNRQPDGSQLTPRNHAQRREAYDLTWSVPKSVSVAYAMTGDEAIRESFEQAVEETMRQVEQEIHTQDGQGRNKQYLRTGEAVWASFTHKTGRPVDGVPDVHLHRHSVLFNATWNEAKQRFQSVEIGPVNETAPYYEAAFDARLAAKLKQRGYAVERRLKSGGRYGWELAGIDASVTRKFSRRTSQIEAIAKEQAERYGSLSAKQKAKIGALSREAKQLGQSYEKLRSMWRSRLSEKEDETIASLRNRDGVSPPDASQRRASAREAVDRATASLFERKTVVRRYQLKTLALQKAIGEAGPEDIDKAMEQATFYEKRIGRRTYVTTEAALRDERELLANLRDGKGTMKPIHPDYRIADPLLNAEQRAAVKHVLGDRNNVTILSGGAGTGKTTLMKEVAAGIRAGGKTLHGFAPTAAASKKVMREEGFENADTVAQLIHNPRMQERVKHGVIWIDEAGLLGIKDTLKLQAIAKAQKARLLLSGDVKQHSAVLRGDALRLLENEGGVHVARIHTIQRQRHHHSYKHAVSLISRDKIDAGLHQLDKLGWVKEYADAGERLRRLAEDHADALKAKKSVLVVSPTHIEGRSVRDAIRKDLKERGMIKGKERIFRRLQPTQWTEEQKTDAASYRSGERDGLVLEFHQNAKGHIKGERFEVEASSEEILDASRQGKHFRIAMSAAPRFTLYRSKEIALASGDRIRITKGGRTRQGSRIYTGDIFTVTGFTRQGDLKLHTGKTLSRSYGHFDQGFTVTSHSSQGRTVDRIFIAQSSRSYPASDRQQFYVSVSRGREQAMIYTDDKRMLEQAVKKQGQRLTAREVATRSRARKAEDRMRREMSLSHPIEQEHERGKSV